MKTKLVALLSGVIGLGAVGAASAADMAVKARPAPPVVVRVYDWSGIYIGGAVGGIWHETDGNFYNAPGFGWRTDSHSDWIAGGFAGIQKQWNNFVFGIEGGWNAVGDSWGSTVANGIVGPCGFAVGESCQSRINNIGYIGGRIGFAWDRWMVYGQGGYARASIDTQGIFNATGVPFSAAGADHDGWYAGAGFDYAVLDYLILGVDYKHYEFDSNNHNCNAACFNPFIDNRSVSATADSVMGRVSFKFNPWPTGPVVAKY